MKKNFLLGFSLFFLICILIITIYSYKTKNKTLSKDIFSNKVELNGYTPNQIKNAYGLDKLNFYGSNQKIAIVVAYGSDTILKDLDVFNKKFNLPEATLQILYPQGSPNKPELGDIAWIKETTMDVQWAHALAPKAQILLVVAKTSAKDDMLNAVEYATKNSANIISISWRFNEFKNQYKYNKYFDNKNIIYVAASGDNGPEVSWPSVHPNVLSVGGTTLSLNQEGKIVEEETACFNSGGGISKFFDKPSYQNELVDKNIKYRSVPDVSFFGDISKGVAIYCSNPLISRNGWSELAGTSLGAPSWSAFIAIANEANGMQIKNINKKLYSIAKNDINYTNFNDITKGNNSKFYANDGYDCVTGLGTPHFNILLESLLSKNSD